jgi:hypothetical protein
MAVNKPVGDNARKGAVKKRSHEQARRRDRLDQAQQKGRWVHGGEKPAKKKKAARRITPGGFYSSRFSFRLPGHPAIRVSKWFHLDSEIWSPAYVRNRTDHFQKAD